MGFETLENTVPTKSEIPPGGVRVSSRAAGRGTTKTRYLAIQIGEEAAKELGFHMKEQHVRLRAGNDADAGKLSIDMLANSKFVAKKQKSGCYLITVNRSVAGPHFALEFEPITIAEPRIIPPTGNNVAQMILKMPQA